MNAGTTRSNGAVAVPEPLVRRWEAAYRRYGTASATVAKSPAVQAREAQAMALASWEVAAIWREIGAVSGLPWWVLAAVEAAAEGFEFQAADWDEQSAKGEDE